jgi:hypothetical protein
MKAVPMFKRNANLSDRLRFPHEFTLNSHPTSSEKLLQFKFTPALTFPRAQMFGDHNFCPTMSEEIFRY